MVCDGTGRVAASRAEPVCSDCGGTGKYAFSDGGAGPDITDDCESCDGTGRSPASRAEDANGN